LQVNVDWERQVMSGKATMKDSLGGSAPADGTGPDSKPARSGSHDDFNTWLKEEIGSLYAEIETESLPPGMAELAAELEEKLRSTRHDNNPAGLSSRESGKRT
jgi:hypothetical protein